MMSRPRDLSSIDLSSIQSPSAENARVTPMMAQWAKCKAQSQGALVLFRLGDFYEAFHDDAIILSQTLDLTLTKRQDVPMCGIPWHSSESYIDRLLQKGFAIAVAEQVEPEKANSELSSKANSSKAIMERKIVRILSPGTAITSSLVLEHNFHFIASLVEGQATSDKRQNKKSIGLSLIDISTGLFFVFEATSDEEKEQLFQEIVKRRPKEIVVSKQYLRSDESLLPKLEEQFTFRKTTVENWLFDSTVAYETLKHHFKVQSLDAFGLENKPTAYSAGAALLTFIRDTLFHNVSHLKTIESLSYATSLQLDVSTLRNLDIFDAESKKGDAKSLFDILNVTKTPMGARLLRGRLLNPLISKSAIDERLATVESYLTLASKQPSIIGDISDSLSRVRDIERLVNRIESLTPSPRDIRFLASCIDAIQEVQKKLTSVSSSSKHVHDHCQSIPPLSAISSLINHTLVQEPPLRIGESQTIIKGISLELDELRELKESAESWLIEYQNRLREELGIKTLKVGFSRAFGYFIEVSKGQSDKMPASFSRRQTLTTGERFISEQLLDFEKKILTAETKITALETELFSHLIEEVRSFSQEILRASRVIAEIDCSLALALIAKERNYTRPIIVEDPIIDIKRGRHPVAELFTASTFTPNDLFLDASARSFLLITGPNMGGKSTYIRQAALLVIMAQMGSFIPAASGTIGIVDRVFSRVGASDDLARGQSTFMVEMTETAHILRAATNRSLVLLDEIGRGTSTYDGLSIAWSVTEFLTRSSKENPRTLFATHYHELTSLEESTRSIKNMTVKVSENQNGIQFLYTIAPGKADKSYGIHVAELAGLPSSVILRAKEILHHLEENADRDKESGTLPEPSFTEQANSHIPSLLTACSPKESAILPQHDLFGVKESRSIEEEMQAKCLQFLLSLDVVKISPLDCFIKIARFQEDLHKKMKKDLRRTIDASSLFEKS